MRRGFAIAFGVAGALVAGSAIAFGLWVRALPLLPKGDALA